MCSFEFIQVGNGQGRQCRQKICWPLVPSDLLTDLDIRPILLPPTIFLLSSLVAFSLRLFYLRLDKLARAVRSKACVNRRTADQNTVIALCVSVVLPCRSLSPHDYTFQCMYAPIWLLEAICLLSSIVSTIELVLPFSCCRLPSPHIFFVQLRYRDTER